MIWVGVTGGIGCGKSTAISFFKKQGFGVVSADQIVHGLYLSPTVVKDVSNILGLDEKGFSKDQIASAVFANKKKLQSLEDYLHPLVRLETEKKRQEYKDAGETIAFYEIPLLFEKNMQDRFDCTLCVGAKPMVQLDRIKKRNNWSDKEIEQRLNAQLPLEKKKKLADFYIDNSSNLEDLEKVCIQITARIKENV